MCTEIELHLITGKLHQLKVSVESFFVGSIAETRTKYIDPIRRLDPSLSLTLVCNIAIEYKTAFLNSATQYNGIDGYWLNMSKMYIR